jgi:hypothetical protein
MKALKRKFFWCFLIRKPLFHFSVPAPSRLSNMCVMLTLLLRNLTPFPHNRWLTLKQGCNHSVLREEIVQSYSILCDSRMDISNYSVFSQYCEYYSFRMSPRLLACVWRGSIKALCEQRVFGVHV